MGDYAMAILWAALFVVALVIESQTAEMVAIWFLPSTLVSLILALFGVPEWLQWLIFVVLSTVLLVLAFAVFRKHLLKNYGRSRTDTDRIIGEYARVEEDIINSEMKGTVKIGGQLWSARMADDSQTASVGEFVMVESISGVKLICRNQKK